MKEIFPLPAARIPPDRDRALRWEALHAGARIPDRLRSLVTAASELYESLADPSGIWMELSSSDFEAVYRGEVRNAPRTPLAGIFPRAEHLALFAVTLGSEISHKIRQLFAANEPALAYVLDTIASERADTAAMLAAGNYLDSLRNEGLADPLSCVLPYSPGYCGWDITAQRKLFQCLRPEQIGITLNASYLMDPLKSVSGVLVAGPPEIHDFDNDFDFCESCVTQECRQRLASVLGGAKIDRQEKGTE
jgi:hypothetical protein